MNHKFGGLALSLALPLLLLVGLVQWVQTAVAEPSTTLVIDAVLYDGYVSYEPDEAVQIRNMGDTPVPLQNVAISDATGPDATITVMHMLAPGAAVWLADEDLAFQQSFGFLPDFAIVATQPGVVALDGNWPGFANAGDEVLLWQDGVVVDCLIYEGSGGAPCAGHWSGTAVQPYRVGTVFGIEGQILYRKRDETTGLPVADTDAAADWAQDAADPINGRRVRYPGWDIEDYWTTTKVTETAVLTVAIAPDNAYDTLVAHIDAANTSIQIASHTFDNLGIAAALGNAAQRGVSVTLLLEGEPTGGISDQEMYNCQQLDAVGAACWFLFNDSGVYDRYTYQHAKYILIDGRLAVVMSENLSPNSLPYDDKSDGTSGRRGVALLTDAPGVVGHLTALFARDLDPANHNDVVQWQENHPDYGLPAPTFVPITITGGTTYTVRYPEPTTLIGDFAFELVQSPDTSLHNQSGLIGLVNRAGAGDEVLVQQLSERPYWGSTTSNAIDDPNLRLEAYIAAARRGAAVRLLLDSFFDDTRLATSNRATCDYVNLIAENENLNISCVTYNPTGAGIHNKMVLVRLDGVGYIHVGSINGTEQSNKGNREVALQVQSDAAYALLADMFYRDWDNTVFLPLVLHNYIGPASRVLISEVLYDSPGVDTAEFIELVNPTGSTIDISGYAIGDAVDPANFEDLRRFPAGTLLPPHAPLVVATTATGFFAQFNQNPDFEILESDTAVPNLIDDLAWGDPATFLQLGNQGDEVILRDTQNQVVDMLVYGSGMYPGMTACELVTTQNTSLERYPYWRDTDDCAVDFRPWAFPNPGQLP